MFCIIASVGTDGIDILGYGHKESKGISAGAISDMRLAQKAITSVVAEAERMAGFNIEKLLIGISGSQALSNRIETCDKITSDSIKSSDIGNSAAKVRLELQKKNLQPIHLIPLQYRIDDSVAIENPRYMTGEKLYTKFHAITTSQTSIINIENCLKRCHLSAGNYIVEPFASALACLSEREIKMTSLVIDIGGSSTSFCIIHNEKLFYVGHSRLGGAHITRDIATILGIRFELAEKIKNLNNSTIISPIEEKEIIKFKSFDEDDDSNLIRITRLELSQIIQTRLEEIFETIKTNLEKAKISTATIPNILITGGVASTIGVDKLASKVFNKNVRIGYPAKFNLAPPEIVTSSNSCALGMIIFLHDQILRDQIKEGYESKTNWFKRIIDKLVAV